MTRYVVAEKDEIAPGGRKLVTVAGRRVVVFNLEGAFYALLDRCPHMGGPLSAGMITGLVESGQMGEYTYSRRGEILRCPWHGWEFDIRNGKSYCDPERVKAPNYRVEVDSGARLVEGPYVAETFKVDVDGAYLVIEA